MFCGRGSVADHIYWTITEKLRKENDEPCLMEKLYCW
jgi:hypothetical protein